MPLTRRQFMHSLAVAISAPTLLAAGSRPARLPIAFSTLGCPSWDWRTVLDRAAQWGYAAIELRGLNDELDLTKRPEFQAAQLRAALNDLDALGLRISDLGASTRLHEAETAVRAAQLDEGKRYIDLAHGLKAPSIRVFGDRIVPPGAKQATVDRVVAGLRVLGEHAKGSQVAVLIESHGEFCDSPTLLQVLTAVDLPNVALLWDAHHTVVSGKEDPAFTWEQVGRYVRHVHLKDSKPEGAGIRYVLTGEGTMPLREIVRLLATHQYQGFYCFEWEKRWHPEIEDPEIAFPQFAKVMQQYLVDAGVKPV